MLPPPMHCCAWRDYILLTKKMQCLILPQYERKSSWAQSLTSLIADLSKFRHLFSRMTYPLTNLIDFTSDQTLCSICDFAFTLKLQVQ